MVLVKRMVLDVLKPHQPNALEFSKNIAETGVENNPDGEGVLVVAVAPNSAAAFSGLRAGDVIVGANKRKVYDVKSLKAALLQSSISVLLRVDRNGGSLYIVIR
jgi:S1-C subfamily serine protease